MPEDKATEPSDDIGDVSVEEIAAIVTRFCPNCSPEEILRLVMEVLKGHMSTKTD